MVVRDERKAKARARRPPEKQGGRYKSKKPRYLIGYTAAEHRDTSDYPGARPCYYFRRSHWNFRSAKRTSDTHLLEVWRPPAEGQRKLFVL
jgi:hypothetical protein